MELTPWLQDAIADWSKLAGRRDVRIGMWSDSRGIMHGRKACPISQKLNSTKQQIRPRISEYLTGNHCTCARWVSAKTQTMLALVEFENIQALSSDLERIATQAVDLGGFAQARVRFKIVQHICDEAEAAGLQEGALWWSLWRALLVRAREVASRLQTELTDDRIERACMIARTAKTLADTSLIPRQTDAALPGIASGNVRMVRIAAFNAWAQARLAECDDATTFVAMEQAVAAKHVVAREIDLLPKRPRPQEPGERLHDYLRAIWQEQLRVTLAGLAKKWDRLLASSLAAGPGPTHILITRSTASPGTFPIQHCLSEAIYARYMVGEMENCQILILPRAALEALIKTRHGKTLPPGVIYGAVTRDADPRAVAELAIGLWDSDPDKWAKASYGFEEAYKAAQLIVAQ